MSQPHPTPGDREPGETPAPGTRPNVELERQRAEGDLPGQRTRDAFREDESKDQDRDEEEGERTETPPTETVPDEAADDAARAVDPASRPRHPGSRDAGPEDPLRPAPSSTGAQGVPPEEP